MVIASAMTAAHRDCPVAVTSVARWPEIQPLVLEVKLFLLTSRNGQTDGRSDNYHVS